MRERVWDAGQLLLEHLADPLLVDGVEIDHNNETATALTSSLRSWARISRTPPSSSGTRIDPSEVTRSGTSNVRRRGT